jgi:hypothetical protein
MSQCTPSTIIEKDLRLALLAQGRLRPELVMPTPLTPSQPSRELLKKPLFPLSFSKPPCTDCGKIKKQRY